MAARHWPQRCAPSPESLMISTICSASGVTVLSRMGGGCTRVTSFMASSLAWSCWRPFAERDARCSGAEDAGEVALARLDAKDRRGGQVAPGLADAEIRLHVARGLAPRAHGFDDRGRAGDDVAAGEHAGHRG